MLNKSIVAELTKVIEDKVLSHYAIYGYEAGGPDENKVLDEAFMSVNLQEDSKNPAEDYYFFGSYEFHKLCLEQMAKCDKGKVCKTQKTFVTDAKSISSNYEEIQKELGLDSNLSSVISDDDDDEDIDDIEIDIDDADFDDSDDEYEDDEDDVDNSIIENPTVTTVENSNIDDYADEEENYW